MDEEDYIQRSEELLKDDSAYQSMEDNPVQKIYNKINGTVNKLVKAELLTKYGQWTYSIPKLHKLNIPLWPVVAPPWTSTYNLSRIITAVKISDELIWSLDLISNNKLKVSFNAIVLFASIEPNITKDTIHPSHQ